MPAIIHKSELVRRAITWLDQCLAENPAKDWKRLVDEASMRFNLGPLDAADLERLFSERFIKK